MVDRLGTKIKEGDNIVYTPNDLRKKTLEGQITYITEEGIEFNTGTASKILKIDVVERCVTVKSRKDG